MSYVNLPAVEFEKFNWILPVKIKYTPRRTFLDVRARARKISIFHRNVLFSIQKYQKLEGNFSALVWHGTWCSLLPHTAVLWMPPRQHSLLSFIRSVLGIGWTDANSRVCEVSAGTSPDHVVSRAQIRWQRFFSEKEYQKIIKNKMYQSAGTIIIVENLVVQSVEANQCSALPGLVVNALFGDKLILTLKRYLLVYFLS